MYIIKTGEMTHAHVKSATKNCDTC